MLALFDITCVAFFFALILTPLVQNLSRRAGILDHPDGGRKHHTSSIPRSGGVAVALSYALALGFLVIAPYRNLTIDLTAGVSTALALAPAAAIILTIGFIDDIWSLKPWHKLVAEVLAAALAYRAGFGIHIMHGYALEDWISLPVTMIWLVACSNALNLIDGMDGLAAGVGVFATLTTFVAALLHDNLELALVTAPLVGALLGFLRYNFNPASIFLGDSGSLLIGFLLGCFGTLWGQKSATFVGMTAPLIALAMPLLDTGLAIARRFLRRQPIFSPDRGHIHHRLLDRGLTPRRAALVLYGFCGLAAVFSLLQDVAAGQFRGLIILLFCAAAWIGVQHLGYAEFGVTSRLVLRGSFRRLVDTQMRMQQFDRTLRQAVSLEDGWAIIVSAARSFGLSGIRLYIGSERYDLLDDSHGAKTWQLRVPFGEGQFLNLYLNPELEIQPGVLSLFPKVVAGFLAIHFPDILKDSDGGLDLHAERTS